MLPGVEALAIDVLLGAPSASLIRVDRAFAIANMARGDGGLAVIIAQPTSLEAPVRQVFAQQIAEAVDGLREHGWDGTDDTRVVIFSCHADGYLGEVEIAVDADTSAQTP